MKPRVDPPAQLLLLAGEQCQILTSEQCRAYGLERHSVTRLIEQGRWRRLSSGVYVTQPEPPSWRGLAWAGVLIGGDRARLGGRAAAHLHGFSDEPELIEVYIPEDTRRADRDCWTFRREHPALRPPVRGEPPRIGIEDTVLDLAADADADGAALVDLVTGAVQSRRTSSGRLLRRIEERGRVANRQALTGLLANVDEGAQSPLELGYLVDVERAHELPKGRRQHRRSGSVRDVLYEDYATLVELDGRLGHEGMGRFKDMDRDNRALIRGEVTLRFGWHDVRGEPCRVAWYVASVLQQRGWPGSPLPCSRCRDWRPGLTGS